MPLWPAIWALNGILALLPKVPLWHSGCAMAFTEPENPRLKLRLLRSLWGFREVGDSKLTSQLSTHHSYAAQTAHPSLNSLSIKALLQFPNAQSGILKAEPVRDQTALPLVDEFSCLSGSQLATGPHRNTTVAGTSLTHLEEERF